MSEQRGRFFARSFFLAAVSLAHFPYATSPASALEPRDVRIGGSTELNAILPFDFDTPAQYPQGVLRLRAEADPARRVRLQARLTAAVGGTAREGRYGFYNYSDVFQHRLLGVIPDEAFAELRLAALDVRCGLQRFAWGKLDGLAPNDALNPLQVYDPVLTDLADAKIGVPALSATYFVEHALPAPLPSDLSLTLVWLPWYAPPRYPDVDERWFPPAARTVDRARGTFEGTDFDVAVDFQVRNRTPPRGIGASAVGVKVDGLYGVVETAAYLYRGVDTQPAFDLEQPIRIDVESVQPGLVSGRANVNAFPVFPHIYSLGGAASAPYRSITARVEAAYVNGRRFTRDLREIAVESVVIENDVAIARVGSVVEPSNTIQWGLGVDGAWRGTVLLGQIDQIFFLADPKGLVQRNPDTRLTAQARRSFLRGRLEASLVASYRVPDADGLLSPQLSYALRDALRLSAGVILIHGSRHSVFGQFRNNDQLFVRLRHSF